MAQVRIPSFLTHLDKSEKEQMMKQLKSWKGWAVAEHLNKFLKKELDRLIMEDEKEDYKSEFQTSRKQAFRLGRRDELRRLIKDLE